MYFLKLSSKLVAVSHNFWTVFQDVWGFVMAHCRGEAIAPDRLLL